MVSLNATNTSLSLQHQNSSLGSKSTLLHLYGIANEEGKRETFTWAGGTRPDAVSCRSILYLVANWAR